MLPLFLLSLSCSSEMSPWDSKIPQKYQGLTQQHLNRLPKSETVDLPFSFALIGDPQGTPGDFKETIMKINQLQDLAFVLVLGDMTDYGLKHEYIWAAEAIEMSSIPVFTVIGNHDAISFGKRIYQKMFGPFNYTFEYAGIKFVMWNNNRMEFGETNFDWLAKEADDRSIIASHIPPVLDVHNAEELQQWQDINNNAGIISSLHGHRGSERSFYWQNAGIPYYVVARNRGRYFAIVTITEDRQLIIRHCQNACIEENL